jgi:hypothetical protein
VFVAVNTARSVFGHVSLWLRDESAFVVASNEPQLVDVDSIRSRRSDASFVSGSPLELLRHLVVVSDDMNGFLDSVAALLGENREAVSTDNRPMAPPANVAGGFAVLQNRAIFDRFRSEAPFGFRGTASSEETLLARAAFSRGSLPVLARAWHASPRASLAASTWLYDELGAHEAGAIRANLDRIAELTATTAAVASCRPLPRFVSRLDRVALSVLSSSGDSLDGTEPLDAIDGTFDPFVGKGWRARPRGRPVSLDLELVSPARIGAVHVVVRPIGGDAVGVRLFARDPDGRWLPLTSGDEPDCDGARAFRLRTSSPELTALRVELAGGSVALHELWAEAS